MLNSIFERRSIRKYKSLPVENEKIHTILRAAMYAPSSEDKRPWHFIIVKNREIIEKFQRIQQYASALTEAPLLIVVCADSKIQQEEVYYLEDCAAATQNLLLAANELELGTCWLGLNPKDKNAKEIKELLNLPMHVEPFCGIAVGYPGKSRTIEERFDITKVHNDKW